MYLKISLVIFFIPISQCSNILAILPSPSYSHQIAYAEIWRELSLRGHKVTLITTDPLNDPKLTNLTEIDINWCYKFFADVSKMAENTATMWNMYDMLLYRMKPMLEELLAYPPIQELKQNNKSFDVVLVEFLFPEFLAYAEIFKCPKIIFSPADISTYFHRIFGNPAHPALRPDVVSTFYGSLNFQERLLSTIYSWYVSFTYAYKMIPANKNIIQKHFNITLSLEEIINDIDMMFINVNPAIQDTTAISPNTINIGGNRKQISSKPISKDLQEFLDGAKDGFIYFSLGSNVKSKELNEQTLQAIIETLREVPYKVIWKFEDDDLPGKPDNVKLIKWAPQQTVLIHPNIKLFVTQGGLQSMEEAIYSAVPLVVIPFFGDQDKNAHIMVAKGIAKIVERQPFVKKSDLKSAILEVINNPSYKNSVERLKQLALDTPMTGLETAVWWTEYIIRNKGAKHLRNPAADIPFYQYYLVDVIGFLVLTTVLVLSVIIFVVKKLVKAVYNYVGRSSSNKKKRQ